MIERVLVVCGAGASSTFLVHGMRRELDARGAQISVEAATLDGLTRAALGASLVLVAHHLEAHLADIRTMLAFSVRVELLPALPATGAGPSQAVDIAQRALAAHTVPVPTTTGGHNA